MSFLISSIEKSFNQRMLGDFLAILIFLTFSLSFLNGIMWATTLRPKALQNELVFVNRQKVLMFGVWQQLDNSQNILQKSQNSKICNKEEKMDQDDKKIQLENTKNLINKYRLQVDKISQETANSNYSPEIQDLVKELISSNQDYLHDLGKWQTEKMENTDLINNWQQKVNEFCTSERDSQREMIPELDKLLIKIGDLKNIQNWQKNNQDWLVCAKKSVEEDWTKNKEDQKIAQEIKEFAIKTDKIFQFEFDNVEFSQKFLTRIESVENWEKQRLKNLPKFENSPKIENTLIFFGDKELTSQS